MSNAPWAGEEARRQQHQIDEAMTEIRRVNRTLRTLSAGNRTLLHATDEQQLLRNMCRTIVEVGGYRMAWVAYAEGDGRKRVQPVAHAGFEEHYLDGLDVTWEDTARGQGPVGTAIRTGRACVVRNIETDGRFSLWRDEAIARGYGSSLVLPLQLEDEGRGALTIYAQAADAFDPPEVDLLSELAADLSYGIRSLRLRARQREAEETIRRLAHYDDLTGLPSRALLESHLADALPVAQRTDQPLALLRLGLRQFRDINDTLGYRYGDLALKEIGARIQRALRGTDMLARAGGDEFAIVLPDTDGRGASHVAQRILDAMDEPFSLGDIELFVRAHVGIALFPVHATDVDLLMRRADIAMCEAQRAFVGFAFHSCDRELPSPRKLELAAHLRQAIDDDSLTLYCQPKIDIASGRLCGAEALARWEHPRHGTVCPSEFIPLSERTGLIKPLTYRILEGALRRTASWEQHGFFVPLAVNISVHNLRDPQLVDRLEGLLSTFGISADRLELELTESAVMEEPAHALAILTRLSDAGFRIFIDDFGTGYSSLGYLQKLPVDAIKIDKSFVLSMVKCRDSESIVRSTIELAHNLGVKVVAEGVEDQQTLERLRDLGCDQAQGYHVARPMPAETFMGWAAESPWLRGSRPARESA